MDARPAPMARPPVRGGPWGGFMDVVLCLLPIIVLLYTTLKKNPMPTTKSLPLSALLIWVIRLAYLSADPAEVTSQAISGMLSAITPITIVAGAIYLFDSMQSANVIAWMRVQMSLITKGHHVAEIMLIGWAFAYLIEGASGFGTPAALATPILLSMGHPKFESVCCLLLMNIFATVFGAVGTPIWFGFGAVFSKDEAALLETGLYASIALGVSAFLLVPLVVRILLPWRQVRANLLFIELSVLSCCGTNLAVASFSYDFPTLLGGMVGVLVTALLVRFRVGLTKTNEGEGEHGGTVVPVSSHGIPPAAGGEGEGSVARHRPTSRPLALGHQDSASFVHAVEIERHLSQRGIPLGLDTPSSSGKGTSTRGGAGSAQPPEAAPAAAPRQQSAVPGAKGAPQSAAAPLPSGVSACSLAATDGCSSECSSIDGSVRHIGWGSTTGASTAAAASDMRPVPEAADEAHAHAAEGEHRGPFAALGLGGMGARLKGRHAKAAACAGMASTSEVQLGQLAGAGGSGAAAAPDGSLEEGDAHAAADAAAAAASAAALDQRLLGERGVLDALKRTCPLWLTVLLLVLTRIEPLQIKGALRGTQPLFTLRLGSLGELWLSRSLVLGLSSILDVAATAWSYEILYVPAILPFAVSGSAALLLFRNELAVQPGAIARGVLKRMKGPALSLVGAIALVNMLRGAPGDISAPAYVVGVRVSSVLSHGWVVLAAALGALGSFFSGSTTVSNLTFGSVQRSAAELIGVNPMAMCALQAIGASFGNAICLNNIIATSTVVGLTISEGEIMKKTAPIVGMAYLIGTVVMIPFLYGTSASL